MTAFERGLSLRVPVDELFAWHARPGAVDRLIPPWEDVVVESVDGGIEDGQVVFRMPAPVGSLRWVARHQDFVAGRRFCDVQVSGPFASWRHEHLCDPEGPSASRLTDRVEYALPLGAIGRVLGGGAVRRRLDRMFAFRHRRTEDDLGRHAARRGRPPLRVAVSGSHGLVGRSLCAFLSTGGHSVQRLVRAPGGPGSGATVRWDPGQGVLEPQALEGVDAVVHLAGAGIADRRWTARRKAELASSRVEGTRNLCASLARLGRPPRVLISASAIGIHGDRGDEVLDEESAPGEGFLADLGKAWEAATAPAEAAGLRVVHARLGVVVAAAGGAVRRMLRPFRWGMGGPLGGGRQWVSWIALDDVLGAILALLDADDARGPVHVVSPNPVRQGDFARALCAVLRRPSVAPLPAFAARLLFGEMADALLLSSQRVSPGSLLARGFRFIRPTIDEALAFELGRAPAPAGWGGQAGE